MVISTKVNLKAWIISLDDGIHCKKLEVFLSQEGLCIFSDGTDTYLHPGNGSYLAIDIYDTDSSLLLDFACVVLYH
jgi:uncharacterized protein (DUF1684 family)